ncbi:MBL fold metallo-hydrolase [Halorussus amylolyticus]|uniref:MBL fold metallo-hydrolase n=1 Tax=Halorussus amylolyticus TaxID=1126242 RepID=UPI00138F64A0|nr:MBL fold metallo-hydrolase [Halorussus amylolyticus]
MTDESPETNEPSETPSVSAEELHRRIAAGERVNLLDVRNREEFESWPIEGESVDATQIPYAEFVAAKARGEIAEFAADRDLAEPTIAVCPRGEASATVADLLREEGIDARNLAGGMEAWARVYAATELPVAPADASAGATVVQYDRPATGCLSYLVVSGGEAAVVDPLRAFADRYVADARARDADLVYAIDTHVHADHLSGVRTLAETTARGLEFDAELIGDGDEISVGDATLTALAAPGHTTELTALRLGTVLFSGDALFLDSFGRPDLERGDDGARDLAATLYDTLRERLFALPDETLVAPGHRTSGAELGDDGTFTARLDAVRDRISLADDREAFVSRVTESLPPRPANYERIIPANLGREDVDDEEGFELELGPNNCAVAAEGE